ncbi:hypothetical protein ACIBQX_06155 [Nonomuraea sp. NPDC049714]|uniref:hypothetical protein n=1 Tax=Nonomuraea sp. NPDC049714 TaxID=3364357 RepID=UPI0037BA053F
MSVRVSRRAVLAALLLAGAATASAPDLAEVPAPWGDEAVVVRGRSSSVAGHHAPAELLRDLARRADAAGRRVAGVLGRPVRPVVLVPGSAAEAAGLAGVASVDGLAAVADDGRVIVVPEFFARLTATGRDVVLTHELTHVAAGTGGLPIWLYEGFADYVAYRDAGLPVRVAAAELAAEVRAGRMPRHLPGPADFALQGDGARLARAYQEAWLACRFLAGNRGERTLVRLYREAQAGGVDGALASLGLSTGMLTERWRAYMRDQLA